MREAEENNDKRQLNQIEIDEARSARHEAGREFFRMPVPREPSSPVEARRLEELYARFVVLGVGRDMPEVMEGDTMYGNSPIGSSYRRRVDALMSRLRIRVEEKGRVERQEQERRDQYRRTSRSGCRRNEHSYRRDREDDDDILDWTRRLFP